MTILFDVWAAAFIFSLCWGYCAFFYHFTFMSEKDEIEKSIAIVFIIGLAFPFTAIYYSYIGIKKLVTMLKQRLGDASE